MNVFVVVGHQGLNELGAAIREHYTGQHYVLTPATWFVADNITSGEVSAKLGLENGKIGAQGVVVTVTTYAGFAPRDLWEWIKSKVEAK